jgi:hypothetical protein
MSFPSCLKISGEPGRQEATAILMDAKITEKEIVESGSRLRRRRVVVFCIGFMAVWSFFVFLKFVAPRGLSIFEEMV